MLEFVGVLLKNWRYVAVLALIVAALVYTTFLQHKVNEYSSQNSELTKQVTALQTTNKDMQDVYEQRVNNLSSAISMQNKDITAYKQKIADLTKNVDAANRQAGITRAGYDSAAQGILTDSTIGDATTCEDTMKYLVNGVADLKWDATQ